MPGPTTEVLNDDLKDLRSDLNRVETALSGEIHQVDNAVAKLAAEFGLFKWLVGASLVASVSGIVSSAYWAGTITTRVTALESRADKVDGRLDRIESSLGGIASRLDRIEVSIAKVASRTEEAGASTPEKR